MNYLFLSKTLLFRGSTSEEIESMLQCLQAYTKDYKKEELIYHAGDMIDSIGLVLNGSVNIESLDLLGNRSILDHVDSGQIFAETYALIPGEALMGVNVIAADNSQVLFLKTSNLLQICPNTCSCHSAIIRNLLFITAQKNLNLSRRIFHTSPKSIRARLISYFSQQVQTNGSYHFSIPFNRQQLADYLSVDRSAMSNELSKMRKEGLISFEKNDFHIHMSKTFDP